MTAILSIAAAAAVLGAFGERLGSALRLAAGDGAESLLVAQGLGWGCAAFAILGVGLAGVLSRATAIAVLGILGIVAGPSGWSGLARDLRDAARALRAGSRPAALTIVAAVIAGAALAVVANRAPLTGSDALNYHFVVPREWATDRAIRADPANVRSFWTGTGHLLILLGYLLSGESGGLTVCLLGGLLATAAAAALGRRLAADAAWLTAALFLLSPMVFWQISISGSPDLWAAFFVALAACGVAERPASPVRTGVFAGLAGGCKMTVWPIALLLVGAVAGGVPRGRRRAALASAAALALLLAAWRPLLNGIWTGDPAFPFGIRALRPALAHGGTISALVADTRGNGFARDAATLFAFPFRLFVDGESFGLGHLFGPVFLLLFPVMAIRFRRAPSAALLWVAAAAVAVNAATTQMGRFLLPVFPICAALSAAAIAELRAPVGGRAPFRAAAAAVAVWLVFCVGADAAYAARFLRAGVGIEDRRTFLEREAPDYSVAEWTNRQMRARPGRVAVFFRHLYYLDVPYVNAAPETSWDFSAERVAGWDAARRELARSGARWVLKTGGRYPPALSTALLEGERRGGLIPAARSEVENFAGNRIDGHRALQSVELFEVRP